MIQLTGAILKFKSLKSTEPDFYKEVDQMAQDFHENFVQVGDKQDDFSDDEVDESDSDLEAI